MKPTVVFVTFESEFSSYGGLGAVMNVLPSAMSESGPCCVMTPLFDSFIDLDSLKKAGKVQRFSSVLAFSLLIRGQSYPVEVIEAINAKGLCTYFISSDDFFTAPNNPYTNPCNPAFPLDPYRNPINPDKLTEDALFFSLAVPTTIVELSKDGKIPGRDFLFHLQDWETAAVAQALKVVNTSPALRSTRCVLTIHNPYDKAVHDMSSARARDCAAQLGLQQHRSFLEQVIPILDAPVSTVSRNFAHELQNEVLHTQIFCPHLQKFFKQNGLIGIDNGIFGNAAFPFSDEALTLALQGNFHPLQKEKWERRRKLADVMNGSQQHLLEGGASWGELLDLSDPVIPVFFVLGRDDPRQKGYDVIVEAIHALPKGQARFIFTPMPGDEGLIGLKFLEDLARQRPGEVQVFPFRLDESVFHAVQQGCSFLVMGSLYEPFGAATEAYSAGMPVVARATGGLVQQVAPHAECWQSDRVLGAYGREFVKRYYHPDEAPTGILFREQAAFADEVEGWRRIVDCGYWNTNPKGDRIVDRRSLTLFHSMAKSAANALQLAIDVYRDQEQYAAMIYHGWALLKQFQWDNTIRRYQTELYQ
ncbi:hypothetical protein CSA56_18345 [candidate division KSB3 bacterium]|uniref:starch synthase n=1 Tax=candidate division KSB3 bacterium TaxID=2044937 RepID=A0A2G6K721_9BACT|nr:MAG: hypothetical protein CSA56_18345 [candidate division KSB3 bacterium]